MRVLLAGASVQNDWRGGEPEVARQLLAGLQGSGATVHTLARSRRGAALLALGATPLDWDPVSVDEYRRALLAWRPDVVLAFYDYDTSLVKASRAVGVPVVAAAHIFWPICPIGVWYLDGLGVCPGVGLTRCVRHMSHEVPDTRLPLSSGSLSFPLAIQVYAKFSFRHAALREASAIVVPSDAMRRVLMAQGIHEVRTIPNAIDKNEFTPRSDLPSEPTVLFSAGSTTERKGFPDFERMASILHSSFPRARFVATNFAGSDAVEGTPYLDRASYRSLVENAHVVVVPSRWEEPFGMVALEAMAAGRPVVAYRSGALPEIVVDGETGLLVDRGNVAGLGQAVAALLLNPDRANQMGAAGRARGENEFDLERMTRLYLDLFDSVIERTTKVERRVVPR